MATFETRTIADGEGVIILLPDELGIQAGAKVTIEKIGKIVHIEVRDDDER
jgi:hypothetical protein